MKNASFSFSGKLIYLRAMEPSDLDFLYSIENDPSMWDVSSYTSPYSRHILSRFIENSMSDLYADRQLRVMICRIQDDKPVGTIDLTDFAPSHRRAGVGIAVHDPYRRNGYASEALDILTEYAFHVLHLHCLYAIVTVDNVPSITLFENQGYEQRGILLDWVLSKEGYKDGVLLQKMHDAARKSGECDKVDSLK